ncbi:MAG: transposase [Ignavibacteriae bacterium]|nr:transposase [Ignavibacteriota bacterium]
MVAHFQIQNSSIISKILEIIRKQAKEGNGKFLRIIDDSIRWGELRSSIVNKIPILSNGSFEHHDVLQLFKCLVIGNIYDLTDNQIPEEISDRKSYQNFIELLSRQEIPDAKIISAFKMLLEKYDLFDELFDKFYEQLLESKLKVMEGEEKGFMENFNENQENNLVDFNKYKTDDKIKMDEKINEIEDRIKKLYERKLPSDPESSDIDSNAGEVLKHKLMDVQNQIKNIYEANKEHREKTIIDGVSEKSSKESRDLLERLISIDERIKQLSSIASKIDDKNEHETGGKSGELYKKLFDTFYNQSPKTSEMKSEFTSDSPSGKGIVKDKLSTIDYEINELKESLNKLYPAGSRTKEENKETEVLTAEQEIAETEPVINIESEKAPEEEKIKIEAKQITPHGVLVLTPKAKKEGIFNDANLTEDYELGYRFYELGFKTGFFNVKLDKNDDATRIATAEFFPNTFWTSVKQRSRWIAGICFQNWKSHKWKGNLSTKYFLFRDRKSIFSFFGAFLSNIVILYFVYAIIAHIFHFKYVYSLVGHSSVLWYLMIANFLFMISRASHRFIFTYNWYGFKYAFFSFFRLILDTFVNFFAIARSVDVFRKTKKKVVWDATSHY